MTMENGHTGPFRRRGGGAVARPAGCRTRPTGGRVNLWATTSGAPGTDSASAPDGVRRDADHVRAASVPDAGTGQMLVTVAAPTNPVSTSPASSPSMAETGHQLVILGGGQVRHEARIYRERWETCPPGCRSGLVKLGEA